MRIVYVGPSAHDDLPVHSITKRRAEIAKCVVAETPAQTGWKFADIHYASFLSDLQKHMEPINDIALVLPTTYGKKENEVLDGEWATLREYHDERLSSLKAQLRNAYGGGDCLVHVDLGDDLSTLYAAYFSVVDGNPTSVTFHAPHGTVKDEQSGEERPKTFAVGGHSVYANFRPQLRRQLASTVLRHAEPVFVSMEGVAACLAQLFPRIGRAYVGDPLTHQESEADDLALSSSVRGESRG